LAVKTTAGDGMLTLQAAGASVAYMYMYLDLRKNVNNNLLLNSNC